MSEKSKKKFKLSILSLAFIAGAILFITIGISTRTTAVFGCTYSDGSWCYTTCCKVNIMCPATGTYGYYKCNAYTNTWDKSTLYPYPTCTGAGSCNAVATTTTTTLKGCQYSDGSWCYTTCCKTGKTCGATGDYGYKTCNPNTGAWGFMLFPYSSCTGSCAGGGTTTTTTVQWTCSWSGSCAVRCVYDNNIWTWKDEDCGYNPKTYAKVYVIEHPTTFVKDFCLGSTKVREWFVDPNKPGATSNGDPTVYQDMNCGAGETCQNGACVGAPTTTTTTTFKWTTTIPVPTTTIPVPTTTIPVPTTTPTSVTTTTTTTPKQCFQINNCGSCAKEGCNWCEWNQKSFCWSDCSFCDYFGGTCTKDTNNCNKGTTTTTTVLGCFQACKDQGYSPVGCINPKNCQILGGIDIGAGNCQSSKEEVTCCCLSSTENTTTTTTTIPSSNCQQTCNQQGYSNGVCRGGGTTTTTVPESSTTTTTVGTTTTTSTTTTTIPKYCEKATSMPTCNNPTGKIKCGESIKGCLYVPTGADMIKWFKIPNSAQKDITITATFNDKCTTKILYVYREYSTLCAYIYIDSGQLNTKTWSGKLPTDVVVEVVGYGQYKSYPICEFRIDVTCKNNIKNSSSITQNTGLIGRAVSGVYAKTFKTTTTSLGDGSDGALSVTSSDTIVNNYAYITTASVPSGTSSFQVNSASGFSPDDEIMIIQMQGSSGAGTYEFARIASVSANTITLSSPLSHKYTSGSFNKPSSNAAQIIRVPQYTTVTINNGASITAPAWNGNTGGIVVFRAQSNVNVAGSIDVSGKGFRGGPNPGGCGYGCSGNQGYQGENFAGIYTQSMSSKNGGGGGGRGTTGVCSGAGGGGYGTGGSKGKDSSGWSWYTHVTLKGGNGGNIYGSADLSTIYLGAGGGSGGVYSAGDSTGGSGGGIIYISASMITTSSTGSIMAKGNNGRNANGGSGNGGGGGGAGGSIYLKSTSNSILKSVTASGGAGGADGGCARWCYKGGGNGGNGRIFFAPVSSTTTTTIPGGGQTTTISSGTTTTSTTTPGVCLSGETPIGQDGCSEGGICCCSGGVSTTTTTLTPGVTTTTTLPGKFITSNFSCEELKQSTPRKSYICNLGYESTLPEDVWVVFMLKETVNYKVISYTFYTCKDMSKGTAKARFDCPEAGKDYSVSWSAYLASDVDLKNPIKWAKTTEWKSIAC